MFNTIGNTDFSSSTLSMSFVSSGNENISSYTSPLFFTTSSIASQYTSSIITDSLTLLFSYPENVQFQEYFQQIYLRENYIFSIYPTLPCSKNSSEVILYFLSSYNGSTLATWVSIDPTTGQISGTTPFVSADSDFDFFVNSQITSVTEPSQKWIRISVVNCDGSNQSSICNNNPSCGDGVLMSYLKEL